MRQNGVNATHEARIVYSEPKFPRDSLLAAYFSSEHRTREPRDPSGHHGWSVGRGCTVPEQPTGRRARDEVDSIFAVNPRPLKCKSETRIAHLTSDRGVDSSGMRWLASRTKALARFFSPAQPFSAASLSPVSAAVACMHEQFRASDHGDISARGARAERKKMRAASE